MPDVVGVELHLNISYKRNTVSIQRSRLLRKKHLKTLKLKTRSKRSTK